GQNSLEYQVCDEDNNCGRAFQYFTIIPAGLDNTTDATDDFVFVEQGEIGTGNVSENDIDPEGDSQTVTAGTFNSSAGTLELSANGDFIFTPASGFSGPSDFVYTTSDGQSSASATLHVLVGTASGHSVLNPDFNVTNINVPVE